MQRCGETDLHRCAAIDDRHLGNDRNRRAEWHKELFHILVSRSASEPNSAAAFMKASFVHHPPAAVVFVLVQTSTHWRIPLPPCRRLSSFIALSAFLTASGCSDPLGPFQPEITNTTDSFQLQATGVTGVTSTVAYSWTNTGTRATINHSTTTTAGNARIVIRDAAGTIVYDKALAPSLNEPTAAGTAGTWTIHLALASYSGTINFRAQKL